MFSGLLDSIDSRDRKAVDGGMEGTPYATGYEFDEVSEIKR